jgi:AcrR family transcriptional regulator
VPRPSRWDDIVAAAAEEFRESGYEGSTIEGVAARVGILKGSLYNYIDSKEDLLYAVIEDPAKELVAELDVLQRDDGSSASDQLRGLFRRQVRVFATHYPAAFVYLQQIGRPGHRPEYREMDRRYVEAIERIIRTGVESGEFPSVRPGIAARAIIGMLDWMQHWYKPREHDADELADELCALALGGLGGSGVVRAGLRAKESPPEG